MTKYVVQSARPATEWEANEADRIEQLAANQLPGLRSTAENWRNGVGAFAIFSTAATFVAAPDVLKTAPTQSVTDGAWLLGIASVLLIAAISFGMRAAFGWPRALDLPTQRSLRAWEAAEVTRTVVFLRVSMVLSGVGFAVMLCAAAVLVFHIEFFVHFPELNVST